MSGNAYQRANARSKAQQLQALKCVLNRIRNTAASIAILMVCSSIVSIQVKASDRAASWPSFRNGGMSTVAGNLPVDWSPEKGITWQQETDGYGQSAPIIFDGHVLLTSVIGLQKESCAVTAFRIDTGEKAWQVTVPASQQGPSNYMNSRAAPTPVADANAVYTFFETGNLIAVDHSGERLWQRDFAKDYGPFDSNHGLGSSPAQTDDFLVINIEHKGTSFLLGIDKRDGSTRWKTDRPSGSSWTTPIVVGEPRQVVVSSAGSLTAYEASSGQKIWTLDGLEGNSVPSPCAVGSSIFVGARIPEFGSTAEAARSNLCVTVQDKSAQIQWRAEQAVCDYASPVVDGKQAYFLNKVGVLSCVDADTGKAVYRERLRAECWATPVVAENGIYFFAKDGSAKVVQRGRKFGLLSTSRLWDADNPPKPETYQEGKSSHGHGAHGGRSGSGGGRAQGMIAAMMKGDANKDGILQENEIRPDFRPMLKRVDTNGDGALDQQELAAMAKSFAERRKNSQQSARDPIVYGVAAVPETIVIRTGTRLYCVMAAAETPSSGQEAAR